MALEVSTMSTLGHIGRIPVRNLWLLMFYASDLYRELNHKKISVEDIPDDIPDLVAEILARAVEKRLHRNLSFGYQVHHAELSRVRGRIDILTTDRRQLFARGRVACRFEELSINTPRNRYVLSALEMISRVVNHDGLAHRCRNLASGLNRLGVTGSRPTRAEISTDRFGRNDADDRFMMSAARLAFDMSLPTESEGSNFLVTPDREENWVRRLYEKAIGGFYKTALATAGWQVNCGRTLRWQIGKMTAGINDIFPSMRTDIVLDHHIENRRIVIDTKFTSIIASGWHREETLRSGYIYQIYAYLMSQQGRDDPLDKNSSGLLIHPSVGKMFDETVEIQGHKIRFVTVDLTSPANEIRQQLLNAVNFL